MSKGIIHADEDIGHTRENQLQIVEPEQSIQVDDWSSERLSIHIKYVLKKEDGFRLRRIFMLIYVGMLLEPWMYKLHWN